MSESWNDTFDGQFAKDIPHVMGCSSCKYFRNDHCVKHNLCRGIYSQPCTDFINKDDPLTRQVELLRRNIDVLIKYRQEHENRIKYLEIYVEKLHRECERLYKQGYSDGVNNTIKDFEKENNNFKLCGKEYCKECEEFGWTCDLSGVAKDGYWTCNIMNTMLAVNSKEDKPTPLDFLESDIIFREEDIKTSQQDVYKAVLGLDAPENALTTVQEMSENAKVVKNIMNDCPEKCDMCKYFKEEENPLIYLSYYLCEKTGMALEKHMGGHLPHELTPDVFFNEGTKVQEGEADEWERVLMSGDKRAIAQYKVDHGYTMSKEEMDILEEEK